MSKIIKKIIEFHKQREKKKKLRIEKRRKKLQKTKIGKVIDFLIYDESWPAFIVSIGLIIIILKLIVLPGLMILLGNQTPIVGVLTCSMEHQFTNCHIKNIPTTLCGIAGSGSVNFDRFWSYCGDQYSKWNINKTMFKKFKFHNGLKIGDVLIIIKTDPDKIKPGDVIVFQAKEAYPIIHRVVRVHKTEPEYIFETKGDHNMAQIVNNRLNEKRIPYSSIYGKAVFKIPYLGYPKVILHNIIKWLINIIK